jgi:hypothetical protein
MDQEAAWWIDFREDVRKLGRLMITPPGVAADRVNFLRGVFKDILTDKEALAEFEKRQQPALFGEPTEMEALLQRLLGGSMTPERAKEVKHVIAEKYY